MEAADREDPFQHVGRLIRIRLVEHALVAGPDSAGLVRVDSRDNENLVCDFVLNGAQTGDIVDDGILVVCGAGADDEQAAAVLSFENILQHFIALCLELFDFSADRVFFLDLFRGRKLSVKTHVHLFHNNTPYAVRFFCSGIILYHQRENYSTILFCFKAIKGEPDK